MFVTSAGAVGAASNAVELVPSPARWKFLNDGSDPGPLWRIAAFNDNGWDEGPGQFGYGGEGDELTLLRPASNISHLTHHFRFKFTVSRPADYTNLLFRVLRDDGVVAYLNDNEIFRMNMPDGPIDPTTPAVSQVTGADENTWFPTSVSAAWLVQGTNILAVELHQTTNRTDASFDLSLTAIGPSQLPRLLVQRQAEQVTLRWVEEGYLLEHKDVPVGTWSWITNAVSPYEVPPGGSRLFRLRGR